MFFRKARIHWPLIFFGVIACGIIIAMSILLFLFVKGVRQNRYVSPGLAAFDSSPRAVARRYEAQLRALVSDIARPTSHERLFATVAQGLLSARVPKELLSDHLDALVRVRRLEQDQTVPVALAERDLASLLQTLIDKSESYETAP